jgi:hypothetical protein
MLDFHANQPFKVRQVKEEGIFKWTQKIQAVGSKFQEAALMHCTIEEIAGVLMLTDKLRNLCFMQGLYSDRIQTIVRSRNSDGFDNSQKSFGGRKCYYLQTGKVQDGKVIFF